jgi:hypothetical protein
LWALLNIGGIFDHRRWALPSELLRLPVTAATLSARLLDAFWLGPGSGGLAMAVVALWRWLLTYRRQFDGAPQPPSRVIGRSAPRADAAASRPTVAAGTVPPSDVPEDRHRRDTLPTPRDWIPCNHERQQNG